LRDGYVAGVPNEVFHTGHVQNGVIVRCGQKTAPLWLAEWRPIAQAHQANSTAGPER
jgi:hypothetical protein